MAAAQASIPTTFYSFRHSCSPSASSFPNSNHRLRFKKSKFCIAMVQQAVQGASAAYAKEMERLSAKESLLLAFKDAGGFDALFTGKVTDMQRMDVMERITLLERLNPTLRPTTSPFLEGRWNLEWFGSGSLVLSAAQFALERFPLTLATLSNVNLMIKDTYAKVSANMRVFNSVESKVILSSKLSVEGPLRIKEEFDECLLESPNVIEEAMPEQLRSVLGQAAGSVQQFSGPIQDAISGGIRIPLSGNFNRMFMISYLDEEMFIIRDAFGVPEVLSRFDVASSPAIEPAIEYER